MRNAGLRPVVDYEDLPVSGFGDVLPRYFRLRRSFATLKKALESRDCLGLVAIDYPGFNMKLVALAGKLRKPSLYVAPPQVWAWKKRRAETLSKNPFVKLAVFFDFEERVYKEAGCNVERVQHPFVNSEFRIPNSEFDVSSLVSRLSSKILLLPGSRKSQALRNLPVYLEAVPDLREAVIVAARQELVPAFEKYGVPVVLAPPNAYDRASLYRSAGFAITAPGTATLELALSGCPMAVCTKPDLLTYVLGRLFIRTRHFALPNIILNRHVFQEYILSPFGGFQRRCPIMSGMTNGNDGAKALCTAQVSGMTGALEVAKVLREKLAAEKSLDALMAEFLRQFVECQPQ